MRQENGGAELRCGADLATERLLSSHVRQLLRDVTAFGGVEPTGDWAWMGEGRGGGYLPRYLELRVAPEFCFLSPGFKPDAAASARTRAQVWKSCSKSRLVLSILMHGLKGLTAFPHWQACKNNSRSGLDALNLLRGGCFQSGLILGD